jgi:hypothetical protein
VIKSTPETKKTTTALPEISKFEKEFIDVDEDAEDSTEKKDQPP